MAAEASRPPTGPADSYIGSLISLTSKSEIRYEGVLFTINTEEASIGLRNVRSFGTEGRRKDGPQVPPIDKVYEYIVFRGSDIKDLQVKSSPPLQTSSIHNDPAIIQSQYSQAATSTSLPHVSNAAVPDVTTQMSQNGPPRSPFQSSLPLYQPGGSVASWSSYATPQSGSGPMMPMYQQGFYGASSNLQTQQPPMLQPPQSFSMPSPVQQPVHNSLFNASMQASLPVSQPMLLQPPGSGGFNVLPSMIPGQSVAVSADTTRSMLPSKNLAQVPLPMSQSLGLPLVSPISNALDIKAVNTVSNQTKPVSSPMTSYSGRSEPASAAVGPSISPTLVTPGQFVQPVSAPLRGSQPLQTVHKDVEVVQVSSSVQTQPPTVSASASAAVPKSTASQAPLLPLPSPANREFDRAPLHSRYIQRGRRGRGRGGGRGSELSNSETRFTEDFDFEAMNEKFNKDEVWGHLGKGKDKDDDNEDSQYDNNDVESPQFEAKPIYNKDDFFDSLSSNSLDNGSRNERPRFSEQRRLDTETFGEFSRYRGGRGGRGQGYGRYQRGGHYGRGYGYSGRGRGGNYSVYRAT